MSTKIFLGSAAAIKKVVTCTVGGTILATDLFKISFANGKQLTVVAGSTVAATVATTIVAAINALTSALYPEFKEFTIVDILDGTFTCTSSLAGRDFSFTLTTTLAGGGASSGTFTQAVTVANAGPNDWSTPANWSGGTIPGYMGASDDVILQDCDQPILYGLNQSGVTLTSLTRRNSFTGYIGLPITNTDGTPYPEYRDTYLQIGATTIDDWGGSGRCKINVGSVTCTLNVHYFDTAVEDGIPSLCWKGTSASNVVNITCGDVGIGFFGGETATIATLNISNSNDLTDATVRCGTGVTLTTVNNNGGLLYVDTTAASLALIQQAGDTVISGTGHTVTMSVLGGYVRYNTTATIGAGSVIGTYGLLDLRGDTRAKAVNATGLTLLTGAKIYDCFGVLTKPYNLLMTNGGIEYGIGDLGKNFKATITTL